jgi:hypothetical protein
VFSVLAGRHDGEIGEGVNQLVQFDDLVVELEAI